MLDGFLITMGAVVKKDGRAALLLIAAAAFGSGPVWPPKPTPDF